MAAIYQPGETIRIGRRPGGVRLAGGGATFVGAYDAIPSIAAAYGMRRLRSAYIGSLLRLRRGSDNVESDFGALSNGDLDAAAIATWLGAASGYVTTWYDQSGNGYNAVQTTAANQPLYVASGQNDKPVVQMDGTSDFMVLPTTGYDIGNLASIVTAQLVTTDNDFILVLSTNAGGDFRWYAPRAYAGNLFFGYSTDQFKIAAGVADTDPHIFALSAKAAGAAARIDGVQVGTTVQATGLSPNVGKIGSLNSASDWAGAVLMELILLSGTFTPTDVASVEVAANSYWGVYA